MSVIQVLTKGRGTTGSADSDGRFRYGLAFQVITNDEHDEAQVVGAALGISPFDQYSFGNGFDPMCHAKSIDIRRQNENPFVWDVDVEFDNQVQDWDENPLARPTVVNFSFVQFEEPYWQDVKGNAAVNSAGILFDPPLTRDQSRLHITMERNELVFPIALALTYQDATNLDAWFGFAPGQAKMMNITGTYTKESGYSFYAMNYEVQIRNEGWTHQPQNCGYTQGNGEKCQVYDSTGVTLVDPLEPQPLDADGMQLAKPYDLSLITYKTLYPYRQLPFAALALP